MKKLTVPQAIAKVYEVLSSSDFKVEVKDNSGYIVIASTDAAINDCYIIPPVVGTATYSIVDVLKARQNAFRAYNDMLANKCIMSGNAKAEEDAEVRYLKSARGRYDAIKSQAQAVVESLPDYCLTKKEIQDQLIIALISLDSDQENKEVSTLESLVSQGKTAAKWYAAAHEELTVKYAIDQRTYKEKLLDSNGGKLLADCQHRLSVISKDIAIDVELLSEFLYCSLLQFSKFGGNTFWAMLDHWFESGKGKEQVMQYFIGHDKSLKFLDQFACARLEYKARVGRI